MQSRGREELERVRRVVDDDELVALVQARGAEISIETCRLVDVDEARHRDPDPRPCREPQRGRAVMRQAVVPRARIGERDAQACDGLPPERGGGVEHGADLDAAEPEARVRAHDSRTHRNDRGICAGGVARDRERGEDRHGLEVASERVAAGDGGVEEPTGPELRDQIRQGDGQPGAVGHHVRESRGWAPRLERCSDRRDLAVQRRSDDRHPVDALDLRERLEMFLGTADIGLEARVAALDDVSRSWFAPLAALEIPVDDVPAARAEAELDGCRVHDDAVPCGNGTRQLCQCVRASVPVVEVDLDALQSRSRVEQRGDGPDAE